ncbi:hypothetical protein M378DRAFT_162368 [Amanita muscaria Koide BX008]|uniref:Uncharacterized protein n=1 Tax=Amanita muscaria (strain Koide BX008) TaxID=946122 RepID=A0A0C2WTR1_AMAMK|nr:hypothetical protein M378DRAFT_162368 [Amanita muscaria Koide BX008]
MKSGEGSTNRKNRKKADVERKAVVVVRLHDFSLHFTTTFPVLFVRFPAFQATSVGCWYFFVHIRSLFDVLSSSAHVRQRGHEDATWWARWEDALCWKVWE